MARLRRIMFSFFGCVVMAAVMGSALMFMLAGLIAAAADYYQHSH